MRISFIKFLPFLFAVITQLTAFGQSQFYSVSGIISDSNANPLAGATIKLKNTYTGSVTNSKGEFTIKNVPIGTNTFEVTFIGFTTQIKELNVKQNTTNFNFTLKEGTVIAKDFVILASKVTDKTPMAVQNIDSMYLAENNIGLDLPIILDQATSVVSTSDAGNGVGYTGMRIRGSDATRVNVTINGVPLNDPESQGTYFVNLPDFASSVDDIQIQRGIGTSTNGAGAFGGSVNINTTDLNKEAYGKYAFGMGSFNTLKNTLAFGTGLTKNGFAFDGRLSMIESDGYIDRATSDLKSYYAKAGYYGKKFSAKFITFGGNERTYQAWNGVPLDYLDNESTRTFNIYDYKDQVDDYSQTHYQLHLNYDINANWKATLSGFYVLGQGFYEEYKGSEYNSESPQEFADYGLEDVIIGGDTITETNLIRRRWLDNTFGGALFNVQYTKNKLNLVLGGGYNEYDGKHFGEITWAEYASNSQKDDHYYDNTGIKTDFNIFAKGTYEVDDQLTVFADLQYRAITYKVSGVDNDQRVLSVDENLQFINPKFGFNFDFNNESRTYASVAIASHEPSRGDYIDAKPGVTPKPESMVDVEAGYHYKSNKFSGTANFYYMDYVDQLVLTGAINDVGDAVRQNVKSSYRTGIELELGYRFTKKLTWSVNATLSQNKIKKFVNFTDDWYTGGQDSTLIENVDIAFSPNTILGSVFSYKTPLFKTNDELGIALISKYVGEQYFDNTQSNDRKLDSYFTNDIRLSYTISNVGLNKISFNFIARNVFNTLYVSNAWSYTFKYSDSGWDPSQDDIYTNKTTVPGVYQMSGYFPQATANWMMGLTLDF
ncbi:MAG: TonB-dependent receptor [Salibacteraceae bacterium]